MFKPASLVACLCLLAATPTAHAQLTQGIHLGLTGGVNSIDIRNPYDFPDPEINHVRYTGASFGLLAGYNFDDTFGIRTGLLFARLGRKAEETFRTDTGGTIDVRKMVDLNYVQIPLLLRLNIGQSLKGFYTQFGFTYSLLQDARVIRNDEAQADAKALFRNAELGFLVEVGPSYPLTRRIYATLGLRGYIGFSNLNSDDLQTTGVFVGKSQNLAGGVHLSLHYLLPR